MLDNLRLSLTDLAGKYAYGQRDRNGRADRDGPLAQSPDYDAFGDSNVTRAGEVSCDPDMPDNGSAGHGDDQDLPGQADDTADQERGLSGALRAASELNDGLPGPATAGSYAEMGPFAGHGYDGHGYEEPYRPWFMSGDPSTPWWAADDIG